MLHLRKKNSLMTFIGPFPRVSPEDPTGHTSDDGLKAVHLGLGPRLCRAGGGRGRLCHPSRRLLTGKKTALFDRGLNKLKKSPAVGAALQSVTLSPKALR